MDIWSAEVRNTVPSFIHWQHDWTWFGKPNLKQIWSYIKSLRKDNTGLARLKDKGRLFNAAVDKANILNRRYQSVFTQEELGEAPCPDGFSYPDMTEWNTETLTAPKPKTSSRSRQSFSLLSRVCHWASPNFSSHLQQVPQPRHRTWRLATCKCYSYFQKGCTPRSRQLQTNVAHQYVLQAASCIVSSAILWNTLTLTTFSLIVSMGLWPGGAVKHRASLSFMNSPHRWTKVLKQPWSF